MSIKKSFDATGGTKSVEYKLLESVCKNISIKVKSSDDWIKAVTKESEGKKTIEITVSKNEDDDPRNGTVTPSVNDKECSLHVISIEQAGGSPEPPGPKPDPKPTTCVTPTDNCYWEENPNKSVPDTCINQWNTPNNHWWSGPIDDGTTNGDDRGLDTVGDISEGDTIRINFTGNTGGQFVTAFTSSTFSAIVDSNCSSWLSFRVTNDIIMPGGHGQINYKVTENTGECRQGFVQLYTDGSATDYIWEGHPIGTPFCPGPSPVWIMQTGSGSGPTPTTCTLDVKGNKSSGLDPIPAEGTGGGFVKVGTYETTCKGNWVLPPTPKEGGVDFVTAWEFRDDGGVYAKAGTNKGKAMSTKYNVTKGDANDDFIIDQAGSDSCNKEKAAFRITGNEIGYETMSMCTVAAFTANCTDGAVVHFESGVEIISNVNSCTIKDGVIKCPVNENTEDSEVKGNYSVYIGEERCDGFTITQKGQGCEVSVTIDGLDEGDTVKLQWGKYSTPSNVGNGTHNHTLNSGTDSITANVFDTTGKYDVSPLEVLLTCEDKSKDIRVTKKQGYD